MLLPPAGEDQAIGILTHRPTALLPEEWHERARRGQPVVDAYAAYRNLQFLADETQNASVEELAVAQVKITHS